MKKHLLISLVLFLSLIISCSKKTPENTQKFSSVESTESPVIGFSIDTLAIERWQRDLDLFMNEVRRNGAEVIVQNAGNSIEEQQRQLLYLAQRKVDVIVIVAKEAKSFTETIDKIHAKNIPVIAYDRLILDADVDLYMTIDSEKVGRIMAQKMMSITPRKDWTLILGPQEDNNMSMIKKGIDTVIDKMGIHIRDVYYTAGWNYDLSRQVAIDLVTSGNMPGVIVCGNDAVADSVIGVLNQYYTGSHIFICGQDADIAACQNIVKGTQDFTVYKPIGTLAEQAAKYAVRLARGEKVSDLVPEGYAINNGFGEIPCVMLEPVCVTKSNLKEVVIESGFHTEGEIYR